MASTLDTPIGVLRGGEWLLTATAPGTVWTPERVTEEQRLIAGPTNTSLKFGQLEYSI